MILSQKELKQAELAWPDGDRPVNDFHETPTDEEVLDLVRAEVIPELGLESGSAFSVYSITPQSGVTGRFRLTTDEKDYFIRITSRMGHPELEKKICDYLFERKASVNPVTGTRNITWNSPDYTDNRLRIDIRPFMEGNHFSGSHIQLESLGREISQIHEILACCPFFSDVRSIVSGRYRHYADAVRSVLSDLSLLYPYAEFVAKHIKWFEEMSECFDPFLDLKPNAQCLHGEIHPGNVIFEMHSGRAVLLDFEESVQVFAPVSWDLAYAVQRFILNDNPEAPEREKRIAAFEKGYGKKLPSLAGIMRQAAWFSMAVILDLLVNHSIITPISELEKFVRLERQAFSLDGLI